MEEFLSRVNDENNGLIDQAREWIAEGWGLKDDPTPEQIAAALLMEARTQDECVKAGQGSPEFPRQLRQVAFTILDASILKSDHPDSDACVILRIVR
jgi:hypothetical protein